MSTDPASSSLASLFLPAAGDYDLDLTPKQRRFVEEYVIDFNGRQAAIRAGYSERAAAAIACENLTKPNVAEAIRRKRSEIAEGARVSADWIRDRLRANVERSMQAVPVRDNQGQEIGVFNYNGNVANRSLELLGKDLGMFTDRVEVTLNGDSRSLLEALARLAVACCADDKRQQLIDGLAELRQRYARALTGS